MKDLNFLGDYGYLTDEQRKLPLVHGCEYFTFKTNIELSEPIQVLPYGRSTVFTVDQYSRDLASFMCFWTHNVHKSLNGFSGFHNLKFKLNGITLC